jgi:ornithine cyclodeaminase/alanine dehydrogenase-like protein (mu-crystallin family)
VSTDQILLLKGNEIGAALKGREHDILNVVARAYEAHASGNSSLPHSTFLRFPDDEKNRIIALPAYLGDGFGVCGYQVGLVLYCEPEQRSRPRISGTHPELDRHGPSGSDHRRLDYQRETHRRERRACS